MSGNEVDPRHAKTCPHCGGAIVGDEPKPEPERVPFSLPKGWTFQRLSGRCKKLAREKGLNPTFGLLLRIASECPPRRGGALEHQQQVGATYKTLALVAHLLDMDYETRLEWYEVAESIPLSQRHAGHLVKTVSEKVKAS